MKRQREKRKRQRDKETKREREKEKEKEKERQTNKIIQQSKSEKPHLANIWGQYVLTTGKYRFSQFACFRFRQIVRLTGFCFECIV